MSTEISANCQQRWVPVVAVSAMGDSRNYISHQEYSNRCCGSHQKSESHQECCNRRCGNHQKSESHQEYSKHISHVSGQQSDMLNPVWPRDVIPCVKSDSMTSSMPILEPRFWRYARAMRKMPGLMTHANKWVSVAFLTSRYFFLALGYFSTLFSTSMALSSSRVLFGKHGIEWHGIEFWRCAK